MCTPCSNFALANSHARHKRYALECFCGKLLRFLWSIKKKCCTCRNKINYKHMPQCEICTLRFIATTPFTNQPIFSFTGLVFVSYGLISSLLKNCHKLTTKLPTHGALILLEVNGFILGLILLLLKTDHNFCNNRNFPRCNFYAAIKNSFGQK